ncbi:MAG: TIGR04013 family B12-binding domain/radical SAM domain-containing protein [Candidatus Hermodarchaeota archaeon]
MQRRIALVAFYQKQNIYSFNALIGAIETEELLNDIKIHFIRGYDNLIDELKKIIARNDRIIVGISFFTTQLWEIKDLIKDLRRKYSKKVFLIAGGPHPSGDPFGTLKMGFDLVVVGEGEETFVEILKKIKFDEDIYKIKGLSFFNKNNNYIFSGKRQPIDLDKYPPLPMKSIKFGAIEITRGCPYVCYFCQTPYLFGTNPRHRSIESICNTVKFMRKYEKKDIRFISPNAFSYGSIDGKKLNLTKLEDLLKHINHIIKPSGRLFLGSFPSEVRPEHVNKETLGLVLKYAANDNIVIGAQSGSQKVLDLCNRGHTVGDIYKAVELTINSGLKANVDFIFGLPYEIEEDVDLTIKIMKDLSNMGAKIHTHTFMPLPQTLFATKPFQKVNKKIIKVVTELNSKGLAYGEWKQQEKLAIKIAKYLKSQNINGLV